MSTPEKSKVTTTHTDIDSTFAYDDADLVLQSSDGVSFHVHSLILKLSSSVFRDMLDIPQANDKAPQASVSLSEPANVVSALLDIIYPVRHSVDDGAIDSLELLNSLVLAAAKYDVPVVNQAMRAFVLAHARSTLSKFHPVEIYGLAWNSGFADEAKTLSNETLRYNLNTPEIFQYLKKIDSTGVVKLQILHRRRKVIMLNALNSMTNEPPFALDFSDVDKALPITNNPQGLNFSSKYHSIYDGEKKHAWMVFKYEVVKSMEDQPDGLKIRQDFILDKRFSDIKDLVDLRVLEKEMARILDSLPTEIDI